MAGPASKLGLMVLAVCSLHGSRTQSIAGGLILGLLEGGIVGSNFGAFIVTRVLAGLLLGSVRTLEFDANFVLAALWAALTTLVAHSLFVLGVPSGSFLDSALATLTTALLNAALAIPTYGLVSRILASQS